MALGETRNGIMRTKSVEQSVAETDEPDTKLRKDLGTWDLIVFGVAVVIGAGIFTLAASTAGDVAGPSVSLAFVLAAIACALAALCYAEFASTVPVAGSAYTFSYATFGEFIAVLTTLLALGTKLSSRVSLVITTIKVAIVLLVIILGAFYINAANYTPFIPPPAPAESDTGGMMTQSLLSLFGGGANSTFGVYGLLAAASLVFFAFIGFDVVATTAEETRNPQRSLPRGILGSLAIVTVLYVAVALVLTGMVPYTDLATQPDGTRATLATAFASLGVNWAATIISIGALAGLTTVVMVLLLGQIRVAFAMSRDGLLPRWLSHTGAHGTPYRVSVIIGAIVAFVAVFFPIGALEEMVNIGTLFAFVLVSIGVVILRRTRPDLPRGFRTPLVPLVPILAVLACLWLMLNLSVETWLRFVIWMAIGVVIY